MNKVALKVEWKKLLSDTGVQRVMVSVTNPTKDIALMIRLKSVKDRSGERILPVYYEDNYFSLLPGESKNIALEFDPKHLDGEQFKLLLEGWNIEQKDVPNNAAK
jgi:predicted secreted protein